MGYPMTYDRVLGRGNLHGNYTHVRNVDGMVCEWQPDEMVKQQAVYDRLRLIAGDMRRLERDCMTDCSDYSYHKRLCEYAGVDSTTLRKVLHAFFTDCGTMPLPTLMPHDNM